jgi:hypothetical protein
MGGGGNWELGTYNGNWEQPTNFAGSQLLRQVFGAASVWWGLLYIYKRASFVVHKRWPLALKNL